VYNCPYPVYGVADGGSTDELCARLARKYGGGGDAGLGNSLSLSPPGGGGGGGGGGAPSAANKALTAAVLCMPGGFVVGLPILLGRKVRD
jgi:hypothetical protein